MADRGAAPAGDPGGHAQAAQVTALGAADGKVKTAIFGGNASKLYNYSPKTALGTITNDKIAAIRAEYVAAGGERSNARYGYICAPFCLSSCRGAGRSTARRRASLTTRPQRTPRQESLR